MPYNGADMSEWPTFSPTTEAPTTASPTGERSWMPSNAAAECLGLGWHVVRFNEKNDMLHV